jgi:hypothetical protein
MIKTSFENCHGPLQCVYRTKIPWQEQRESLSIDQSQSKETGSVQKDHCVQIETPLILYSGSC